MLTNHAVVVCDSVSPSAEKFFLFLFFTAQISPKSQLTTLLLLFMIVTQFIFVSQKIVTVVESTVGFTIAEELLLLLFPPTEFSDEEDGLGGAI